MNYVNQLAQGFLFAIGVALAFLLLHAINIAPGICR